MEAGLNVLAQRTVEDEDGLNDIFAQHEDQIDQIVQTSHDSHRVTRTRKIVQVRLYLGRSGRRCSRWFPDDTWRTTRSSCVEGPHEKLRYRDSDIFYMTLLKQLAFPKMPLLTALRPMLNLGSSAAGRSTVKATTKQSSRDIHQLLCKRSPMTQQTNEPTATDAEYAQQICSEIGLLPVHRLLRITARMITSHEWPRRASSRVDRPVHRVELMRTKLTLLGYVPVMPWN